MRINIKVNIRKIKNKIKKLSDNDYVVDLKSPAENNKANIELIKLLKKHFKKEVKIVSGLISRKKVVELK